MSDQEIISQLRTGQQHKALVKLYAHLPKVERMVRNHSGTRADAKDLFQDALIILLGKAKDEGFTLSCSISTYLYAICRNRWQEELRRRGRFTQELEALPEEPNDLGAVLADEQNISLAERALQALGDKCQELLKRFYLLKEPLLTIAKSIGLAGEGAAKTRKYKCLEEARKRYRSLLAQGSVAQPQHP
ncbi:MAG: sigma-70 family RNA polymerase sigma factor [Flavobacteriales bacterium]|jgi:RNA polymerase sigma factor (sigma-70 family)|nr:sigma-70 family RNA polymerase sigma factor [Flavobacteriales bacterium]MBK9512333.1 sigma-70 family RNA polymerase sigma factor [Flavobacteriales bacterium]MBP7408455.1 sigma-70 family RNA polymerase sigma factor [Flavobacteriales bacterium]HOZ41003.1 sigma-70 family RNA polymerase sigma factor [Flavobacteriales bacterium]